VLTLKKFGLLEHYLEQMPFFVNKNSINYYINVGWFKVVKVVPYFQLLSKDLIVDFSIDNIYQMLKALTHKINKL